jgi:CRP-like cAMP-binding protein
MARKKDPLTMLASVPLFEGMSRKDVSALNRASKHNAYPAGKTIVREGTVGVAFHLIVSGRARVTIGGRTRGKLGPGDFFGELAIIDRGRRSATIVAETAVETLSVTSWDFLPMLDANPGMARKVLTEMSKRLRGVERSLSH